MKPLVVCAPVGVQVLSGEPVVGGRGVGTRRTLAWAMGLSLAVLVSACSTTSLNTKRAPVVDRVSKSAPVETPASPAVATEVPPPPGVENAGKPGYYTIRPGDTLIRIGLETGQNWRDLQTWNGLLNPNLIEVGQVIRVVPPVAGSAPTATATPLATPLPAATGPVASPVTPPGTSTPATPVPTPTTNTPPVAKPVVPKPAAAPAVDVGPDEIKFAWPASGKVLDGFDETRNKGLDIGGKTGDAVLAAADGKVVYAGAGLRGYGNLVILKHNNTYLTAYAHNQALLVKEDQTVRKGQKIAEMGNSDSDKVKLHFEVRRLGKPVDPVKYLTAR